MTTSSPLPLALLGSSGRMGRAVRACVQREPARYAIAAAPRRGEDLGAAVGSSAAVIDFSLPESTPSILAACRAAAKPVVIGTTGHSAAQRARIEADAREFPILLAANFSVGVNALFWLTRKAAEILGPDFDLEIIETHHRLKQDAPSGTARRLAEILAETRELDLAQAARHGREGSVGARTRPEIGIHAVRGGDVVGEHTVLFAGDGERLELTHRAASRETFALGALRAAEWLARQPAGRLYDMEDVLGLRGT